TTTLDDQRGAALGAAWSARRERGAGAGDEDLAVAAAVAIDGDALAAELERELVGGLDVGRGRVAAQVDRLADRGVDVALKCCLHADVPLDADFVRGGEGVLDVVGDVGAAAHAAVEGDRGE